MLADTAEHQLSPRLDRGCDPRIGDANRYNSAWKLTGLTASDGLSHALLRMGFLAPYKKRRRSDTSWFSGLNLGEFSLP
jgi:hypothetical protein